MLIRGNTEYMNHTILSVSWTISPYYFS